MAFDKARCSQCPLRTYWQRQGKFEPLDFVNNGSDSSRGQIDTGRRLLPPYKQRVRVPVMLTSVPSWVAAGPRMTLRPFLPS